MGHPRAPHDRPHRLPLADPAVHRGGRRDRVRRPRRGLPMPSGRGRSASTRRARSTRTATACAPSRRSSRNTTSATRRSRSWRKVVHGADVSEDADITPQSRPRGDRPRLHAPRRGRPGAAPPRAARVRRALRVGTAAGEGRLIDGPASRGQHRPPRASGSRRLRPRGRAQTRRRLYIAHTANDAVDVIDLDNGRYLTSIGGLKGVAGALVDEDSGTVFTSNRGEDTVGIFPADDPPTS